MSQINEQTADYQLADLSPMLKTADTGSIMLESLPVWLSAQTRKSAGRGRSADNTLQYGVQKLRELILELAVRGKLVSQDPNDEPASTLLEKIAEKKSLLVEKGKIKKQQEQLEVSESDKPFELPRGWTFERFINILDFSGGGQPPKHTFSEICLEGYVQLIQIRDLGPNPQPVYIPKEKASKFCTENDVMVGRYGASVGKVFRGKNGAYNVALIKLHNDYEVYTQDFLYLVMSSPLGQSFFNGMSRSAQAGFSKDDIASKILPVVPLAEQHRIVKKVDELMALCDQLEQQQADAVQAHDTLVKVLLDTLTQSDNADDFQQNWCRIADHFDTLFTTESSIDQLKQTLLQLAVMGKLVPQDPNDEPASILLEKIAAEKARLVKEGKIKKQKPLPPVSEDEVSLKMPSGWKDTRLQFLATEISTGPFGSMIHKSDYQTNGVPLINPSHMYGGKIREDETVAVSPEKASELQSYSLVSGDVVMARRGEVGRCAIVSPREHGWFCGTGSFVIRFTPEVDRSYIYILLMTSSVRTYLAGESVGTTMTNLNHGILNKLPIALPPENEQKRIVDKVDQLMAMCDQLKDRLGQAQTLQQQLADAVVAQAVK